jgi:hypothetical protein
MHRQRVEAAEALYEDGIEKQAVRLYMGAQDEHTVFEAVLVGAAELNYQTWRES